MCEEKQAKSLSLNAILNMIKTIMSMIFPLITYPYITRVLQISNIGKFNFSYSIIGYFTLFAAYGVATYAVREGAKVRDDKAKFQEFGNEIFTFNMITTLSSYIVLGILLFFSVSLEPYKNIILILSIAIIFTTIGTDWINIVYEDFMYIAIRTIFFQIISLAMLFIFVHSINDIYLYAWITLFASAGANFCNSVYCRKNYARVRLKFSYNLVKHFKPMTFIFLSNITTTIFVNSDQTMLGLMCGDYSVGLYAIAVKIYSVAKNIFTAVLLVVVPRISYMQSNNTEKAINKVRSMIAKILIAVVLPIAIGLFLISDKVVLVIGGADYKDAVKALQILSVSLICAAAASYMTYILVVPSGKENILLMSSTVSAVINVGLNVFLIPLLQQNGAAITTVISEFIVFIIEFSALRPKLDYKSIGVNTIQVLLAAMGIVVVNYVVRLFCDQLILSTCLIIIFSGVIYILILLLLQNCLIKRLLNRIVKNIE